MEWLRNITPIGLIIAIVVVVNLLVWGFMVFLVIVLGGAVIFGGLGLIAYIGMRLTNVRVRCPVCGLASYWSKEQLQSYAAKRTLIARLAKEPYPCFEEMPRGKSKGCGANLAGLYMNHPYVRMLLLKADALRSEAERGLEYFQSTLEDRPDNAEVAHELKAARAKLKVLK